MAKKTIILIIIAVVLLIGLIIGGYFWWNNQEKAKTEETTQKITESVTQGALPSIGANPLESKPDINPAGQANPFKNIKINPFE